MTVTSRTIVRTGIAQFFGGTSYDSEFRCYRGGPLLSSGLSTVRPYWGKRIPDTDFVLGQAAGRGMGALMVLQMAETRDTLLTPPGLPGNHGGRRELVYPVTCHLFHMAHMNYAEDAEADVDNLDQAIRELIYGDPTLGATPGVYQSGMNSAGIRTRIDDSDVVREITRTHFRVMFDVQAQIVV